MAHGALDLARSVRTLEQDGLTVPKDLQERIAWAVAWNIGPDNQGSMERGAPRVICEHRDDKWSLETAWEEVWRVLTEPLKRSHPGSGRMRLDELALSVLCEQREEWQPEASRPLDPGLAEAAYTFADKRDRDLVIRVLRKQFGDRAGAPEEIAQEAWTEVYQDCWSTEACRRFVGLSCISALVCRVGKNIACDNLRAQGRHASWEGSGYDDGDNSGISLSEQIGVEVDPGEQVMMGELRRRLDECMQALSPRQQIVAELIWMQEKAAKAVAEQLRVSEPAISQHVKKARESVRGCLERHGYQLIC